MAVEGRPDWCPVESEISLSDGTKLLLRQACVDDSRLIRANFSKATIEDIRQQFFEYLTRVPEALIDRLTHIDQACELALVALPLPGDGAPDDAYGVVRLAADPACRVAEFAIIIRHDWQGRGLGWVLTDAVLKAARRRGLASIFAFVFRDNAAMILLLREFGFAIHDVADDWGVVRAELQLTAT